MTLLEPRLVSGGAPDGHLEELRRDPIALMRRVRDECGDVGRFDLAGRPVILLSGAQANEYFFRAPDEDLDQAGAYPFMTPIFGEGVVFDASPERRREAYARALAAAGAAVVVADISADAGQAVAKQICADGGRAAFVYTDVSDPDSALAMAAFAAEQFGGIDFLVNNAAIYGQMQFDLLLSVDWDYYKKFIGVNMDGALACTRACYQHMVRRGGGAIVNQSSTAAWLYSSFYGLAKVGVNGLTQQLAHELGGMGIRVNAIAPGPTDTQATRTVVGGMTGAITATMALKRLGQPADLVGACLFLLSDEASWITGHIVNVDGGQVFRS